MTATTSKPFDDVFALRDPVPNTWVWFDFGWENNPSVLVQVWRNDQLIFSGAGGAGGDMTNFGWRIQHEPCVRIENDRIIAIDPNG
jgi:hypothetical protein